MLTWFVQGLAAELGGCTLPGQIGFPTLPPARHAFLDEIARASREHAELGEQMLDLVRQYLEKAAQKLADSPNAAALWVQRAVKIRRDALGIGLDERVGHSDGDDNSTSAEHRMEVRQLIYSLHPNLANKLADLAIEIRIAQAQGAARARARARGASGEPADGEPAAARRFPSNVA